MDKRSNKSAGILVWRTVNNAPEFLLAHPGGPFFAKKDLGVWSIPKGEYTDDEEPLAAAKREFAEETGLQLSGNFGPLSSVKLKSGKIINAWAVNTNINISGFQSNSFSMEWPIKSGKHRDFPEVDKIEWFPAAVARQKINERQAAFIDEVMASISL